MKGKYFSGTVLKKDITRFAPIWGLYTVFMLIFVFFLWDEGRNDFATSAPTIMALMGIVNLVYAGIAAVMLFGDLFQSRMCNALHAMPLRREGWFLTHLTAGLLFSAAPNLLGAVLAGMMLERLAFLAYVWLAMAVLSYVFFFGVAVFSCMCAGNRLGAAAIYAIINFLAVVVTFFVQVFYVPLLYGVKLDIFEFYSLSPVVAIMQSTYVNVDWVNQEAVFRGFYGSHWQHLYITFAVGLVFLVLAVLIYRKRQLESAGDFVAVKPAAPIFLVVFSLCAGAVLYLIADELTGSSAKYLFLLVGMAIGFFTGQMLLNRRVNVFSKKVFLQFGILTVAFAFSLSITAVDPIGITRYVPKADAVSAVWISPYPSWNFRSGEYILTLDEAEEVEEITQLHREIVYSRPAGESMTVNMKYFLKNGAEVNRQYQIGADSTWGKTLKTYYNTPECVFGTEDTYKMLENTIMIEGWPYTDEYGLPYVSMVLKNSIQEEYYGELDDKAGHNAKVFALLTENRFNKEPIIMGLVDAIKKDCAEGNMAQVWDYHQFDQEVGYLAFEYYDEFGELDRRTINIFASSTNTIEYLKSLPAMNMESWDSETAEAEPTEPAEL